jgi:hypothetical protein
MRRPFSLCQPGVTFMMRRTLNPFAARVLLFVAAFVLGPSISLVGIHPAYSIDVPPDQPAAGDAALGVEGLDTERSAVWKHRDALISTADKISQASRAQPEVRTSKSRPFTYEETVYNKPRREWWWTAGKFTVVLVGGAIITYFTLGIVAPAVGSAIGGLSGLTGAAAVSQGLALLGGGAIAAGGFGMAGGTFVVSVLTDLAISSALEYSLSGFDASDAHKEMSRVIKQLDVNHNQDQAWAALQREATASIASDHTITSYAIATACLRWAANENLDRTLAADKADTIDMAMSDRQEVLLRVAIVLLEDARTREPNSSLIHHALGNAYWWLSARGGLPARRDGTPQIDLPSTALLHEPDASDVDCYRAALWHYSQGCAREPRNVPLRCNWANALQSDGTLHEAIGVMAGAMPFVESCKPEDRAQLLRVASMLQYQAFTRSPQWVQFEEGGHYPTIDESPQLLAAMQGYSACHKLQTNDVISVTALCQIYREAEPTALAVPPSVLSLDEAQCAFLEAVLSQEQALVAIPAASRPSQYSAGQILLNYRDMLRWASAGIASRPLTTSRLNRLHAIFSGWLDFCHKHNVKARPFCREDVIKMSEECRAANAKTLLNSVRGYGVHSYDVELKYSPEDG